MTTPQVTQNPAFAPPPVSKDTSKDKDTKDLKPRARTRVHADTFQPQLVEPLTPVTLTPEQMMYLLRVLEVTSSDRQFAAKALKSIVYILNPPAGAELTSLTPTSAALGDPSFVLHVHGKGFDPGSKIFWNGSEEPTTVVSDTELTTGVDMSTAQVAMDIPVVVESGTGEASNELKFTLSPAAGAQSTKTPTPADKSAPDKTGFAEPAKNPVDVMKPGDSKK